MPRNASNRVSAGLQITGLLCIVVNILIISIAVINLLTDSQTGSPVGWGAGIVISLIGIIWGRLLYRTFASWFTGTAAILFTLASIGIFLANWLVWVD